MNGGEGESTREPVTAGEATAVIPLSPQCTNLDLDLDLDLDDAPVTPSAKFRYDGNELILSDGDSGASDEELAAEEDDDDDVQLKSDTSAAAAQLLRRHKRKQTFGRRNIRQIKVNALSKDARAAQQAEMERRKRISEKEAYNISQGFSTLTQLLDDENSPSMSQDLDTGSANDLPLLEQPTSHQQQQNSTYRYTQHHHYPILPSSKRLAAIHAQHNQTTSLLDADDTPSLELPVPLPGHSSQDQQHAPPSATASVNLFGGLYGLNSTSPWGLTYQQQQQQLAAYHQQQQMMLMQRQYLLQHSQGQQHKYKVASRGGESRDDAILLDDDSEDKDEEEEEGMWEREREREKKRKKKAKVDELRESEKLKKEAAPTVSSAFAALAAPVAKQEVIEVSDGEDQDRDHAAAVEEEELSGEVCEVLDASNRPDAEGRIIVNRGHRLDEPDICLAQHIVRTIKPHQVSGIRFLYDNLVESVEQFRTTEGFGCILAHSMGLGKTIQIIGFLEVIFQHVQAKSVLIIVPINTLQNWQAEFDMWLPDKTATAAPPPAVNRKKGGLNHPPASSESTNSPAPVPGPGNGEEAAGATTNGNGSNTEETSNTSGAAEVATNKQTSGVRPFTLHVVKDSLKTMEARHKVVQKWMQDGGVLLIGYEMFRLLVSMRRAGSSMPGGAKKWAAAAAAANQGAGSAGPGGEGQGRKQAKPICIDIDLEERREEMSQDFRAALIDPGPQVVICDEGHRIKNSEASISKALKSIRTHRRVVMTGYPLQNNLIEYWCMVDFVRPSYLGTKHDFTNMFQRPIENGQCVDSTPEDRKVMQGRAHVLHELLSGFVQRRSHAILKASLPPKWEYVLLVKMSPVQRALYSAFMQNLLDGGMFNWAQNNTLKTYAVCCKIWNHPDVLWRAIREHKEAFDFDIDEVTTSTSSGGGPTAAAKPTTGNNKRRPAASAGVSDTGVPLHPVASAPNLGFKSGGPRVGLNLPFLPSFLSQETGTPAVSYEWAEGNLWGDYQPGCSEHGGKVVIFLTLLRECVVAGDKMLVFSQSLLTLDLIEVFLKKVAVPLSSEMWAKNDTYFRLDGSTSPSERERMINTFNQQDVKAKLFLLSTRAGCLGVNLVGANRVVVFDASWNPCHDCQAVCRVYRYGQVKPCYIYRLVTDNTMEKKIYDRQVTKQGMSDRVVDELNPGQQFTRQQVELLMDYEDKDLYGLSQEQLDDCSDVAKEDLALWTVLKESSEWVTKRPFTHESLLIDRKDYRLTRLEKLYAKQKYEEDRRLNQGLTRSGSTASSTTSNSAADYYYKSGSGGSYLHPSNIDPRWTNDRYYPPHLSRAPYSANILSRSSSGVYGGGGLEGAVSHAMYQMEMQREMDRQARFRMLERELDEARIRCGYKKLGVAEDGGEKAATRTGEQIPPVQGPVAKVSSSSSSSGSMSGMAIGPPPHPAVQSTGDSSASKGPGEVGPVAGKGVCKVTRIQATTDLLLPGTNTVTTAQRKIQRGEVMEVIQTSKGKYIRVPRTGDLYMVRSNHPSSHLATSGPTVASPTPAVESGSGGSSRSVPALAIHSVGSLSPVKNNVASTPFPPSAPSVAPTPFPSSAPSVGSAPFPPSVGSTPFPSSVGSTPFPSSVGSTPFPSSIGSTPFPSSVGSTPFPSSVGSTPFPSSAASVGSTPFPSNVGSASYPSSAGSTQFVSSSVPYGSKPFFPSALSLESTLFAATTSTSRGIGGPEDTNTNCLEQSFVPQSNPGQAETLSVMSTGTRTSHLSDLDTLIDTVVGSTSSIAQLSQCASDNNPVQQLPVSAAKNQQSRKRKQSIDPTTIIEGSEPAVKKKSYKRKNQASDSSSQPMEAVQNQTLPTSCVQAGQLDGLLLLGQEGGLNSLANPPKKKVYKKKAKPELETPSMDGQGMADSGTNNPPISDTPVKKKKTYKKKANTQPPPTASIDGADSVQGNQSQVSGSSLPIEAMLVNQEIVLDPSANPPKKKKNYKRKTKPELLQPAIVEGANGIQPDQVESLSLQTGAMPDNQEMALANPPKKKKNYKRKTKAEQPQATSAANGQPNEIGDLPLPVGEMSGNQEIAPNSSVNPPKKKKNYKKKSTNALPAAAIDVDHMELNDLSVTATQECTMKPPKPKRVYPKKPKTQTPLGETVNASLLTTQSITKKKATKKSIADSEGATVGEPKSSRKKKGKATTEIEAVQVPSINPTSAPPQQEQQYNCVPNNSQYVMPPTFIDYGPATAPTQVIGSVEANQSVSTWQQQQAAVVCCSCHLGLLDPSQCQCYCHGQTYYYHPAEGVQSQQQAQYFAPYVSYSQPPPAPSVVPMPPTDTNVTYLMYSTVDQQQQCTQMDPSYYTSNTTAQQQQQQTVPAGIATPPHFPLINDNEFQFLGL